MAGCDVCAPCASPPNPRRQAGAIPYASPPGIRTAPKGVNQGGENQAQNNAFSGCQEKNPELEAPVVGIGGPK
eukprot:9051970-Lingulodinium_polyedra.AAC.1